MKKSAQDQRRTLPAVEAVLQHDGAATLVEKYGRSAVTGAIRNAIARRRAALKTRTALVAVDESTIIADIRAILAGADRPKLRRAVNATGVILHTGLGRSVMPPSVVDAIADVRGPCNLQMELDTGKRGRREENIRDLVRELTGAEDVLLVNNNAAATLLVLRALARGKEVVVSRGELIEIGGSFRLPDIMTESGAILREVGTTNKTHLRDYESAIGPDTALLFKAHKSNYEIVGFSKDVGIAEIAKIGKKRKVPVVDDLGCGALVALETYGLAHEMTVRESLAAGAGLVLFSTDKLIGGPQGGMIVGRADLIAKIKSCPLYRTVRVCKLTLAALEATLRLFRSPELLGTRHPVYAMMAKPASAIEAQARAMADRVIGLRPDWRVTVVKDTSYLGGGSLPLAELPSYAVSIRVPGRSSSDLARQLREADVPVITRIHEGAVLLNMRTVSDGETADVLAAVAKL